MSSAIRTIGIIGAGKLAIVIAQLAIKSGYNVHIAGSGSPDKIRLSMSVLVPGATVASNTDVARTADIVILAIPLGNYKDIPVRELKNKIVIDAMNYWWEVDGERPDLNDPLTSSSEMVQQYLPKSRIVKAFNHIGYHDLHNEARPKGSPDRKAIAIAGNDAADTTTVSLLVDKLGFDPVIIGELSEGIKLQPGGSVFGAHVDAKELQHSLDIFDATELGIRVKSARDKRTNSL